MNEIKSTEPFDATCNRAVGQYLLSQLRTAPPPALANARHPQAAARALASFERVLVKMTEGISLEDALAAREKEKQDRPTVESFDREDIEEFRQMEVESVACHRSALDHLRRGRARALDGAKDRAATQMLLDEFEAQAARALEQATEALAKYDQMLAAAAPESQWVMRPS